MGRAAPLSAASSSMRSAQLNAGVSTGMISGRVARGFRGVNPQRELTW
jgi:hypothetical protein